MQSEQTPQQRSAELRRKIEASLAVASAATEGPWELLNCGSRGVYPGYPEHHDEVVFQCKMFRKKADAALIASARTAYPVLLDYATGLLEAHRVAEADPLYVCANCRHGAIMHSGEKMNCHSLNPTHWKPRAVPTKTMDIYRTQIAALHAALSAQGIIGGKG